MPGYEGEIPIRRDDGTKDCAITIRGRNGEVNLTVSVDGAQFGWAAVYLDLTSVEAHELVGALKDAVHAAGSSEPVSPMSVVAPKKSEPVSPMSVVAPKKWTAAQVGHVLGERD